MGMKRKIAKGLAYATMPKATFAALNPGKAAVGKAASWAIDRASPARPHRPSSRSALAGIAAAAVALPIGIWLGRRIWGSSENSSSTGKFV
jgi:hypothetical protein